jgi:hypothetical protein
MRKTLSDFLIKPTHFVALSRSLIKPKNVGHIQTDGSFGSSNISRTAVILNTRENVNYKLMNTYFDHKNSAESEWCSILNGIKYSIDKDEGSVELENDCLPVIQHLIRKSAPRKGYLQEYYYLILKEVKNMDYLAIRWIPREMNRADDLFRVR